MANKTIPWHFVIELFIIISGIIIVLCQFYIYENNINGYAQLITLIPDTILIISIIIFISTQVNRKPLHLLLKSYVSIIIILSTIIIIICDITNEILVKNNISNWIRTIFDTITYINAVIMVLMLDCVPNITNISRILFPLILISITTSNMYISYMTSSPNQTIFEYKNGKISLEGIQRTAETQMILYSATCVFRVFWDVKHSRFSMFIQKIPRKLILLDGNNEIQIRQQIVGRIAFCCFYVPLVMYYGLILFSGFMVMILYIAEYQNPWILGLIVITKICLIINALYQHFDINICVIWVCQFRCWLLILSILINIFCTMQKLMWNVYEFEDADQIIHVLSNMVAYNAAIFLCLCRDGMKQTFPLYFTVLLCVLLLFVSTWKILFIQFDIDINNKSPAWFIELEKECYYQINFIMLLILISTCFDRNHLYFVLIVRKSYRKEFFSPSRIYSVPTWLLNHGLWYESKSHISGSNIIHYVDGNQCGYGSTTTDITPIRNDDRINLTLTSTGSDILNIQQAHHRTDGLLSQLPDDS